MASYKRTAPEQSESSSHLSPMRKTGEVKLPPDPSMWTDRIYEHIAQTHPYLVDHLQGGIDWSEEPIDEDTGDGIGHITALLGETPIQIPVIVRDYKLSPIDLYMTPKGSMDLIDKDMALKRFDPQNVRVGNSIDPNLQYDRNGYYSDWMGKVGSYDGFAEDCKRVLPDLKEEFPGMSEGIVRVQRSAQEKQASGPEEDTIVVQDMGTGFRVTSFSTGEKVATHSIKRSDAYEEPESILAKAAREADEKGSSIIISRSLDKVAMTASEESASIGDSPGSMDAGDTAKLLTESGDRVPGVMMQRVSLESPETSDEGRDMIFVAQGEGDEGAYSTTPRMLNAGEGKALSSDQTENIIDVDRGKKGFISVPQPGETAAGLSGPVRVKQCLVNEHGERVVRAESMTDGNIRLVLSDKVDRVLPIESENDQLNRYAVPTDLQFVQAMRELVPASSSPEEVLNEKTAQSKDLGIVSIGEDRGDFLCRAEDQEEVLMRKEAQAWLMSLGCKEESAQELTKRAEQNNSRLTVYGLERPISPSRGERHVPPEAEEKVASLIDVWADKKESINKFASQLPNGSPMQSQMASMNMMSQYNAPHFADALEEIQEAKKSVADLLYRARTGEAEPIDEEVTKDALVALDAIVEGLKQIEAAK